MSAAGSPNIDQPRPEEHAVSSGPLSGFNVPWIVLLAAGLPVLVAFVVATVGALFAAVIASEPFDTVAFPVLLGLLSGNEVGATAAAAMFDTAASGRAAVRALPLGVVTISAVVLSRVGFTRAWLGVGLRSFGWALPITGGLLVLAAWFLATIVGSFTGIDVGFASASLSLRPTLTGLLLVGAGPWLLAMLMVRWPVARNVVWGLVGLQAVFATTVTVYVANDIIGTPWMTGGEQAAQIIWTALGSVVWSLNAVVALLWWPFLGALGAGGSAATIGGMAGETMHLGFLEAAGQNPGLWVLPAIGVAGVVLLSWFQPPPRSWTEVRLHVGRLTLALGAVFLPGLWAGRLRIHGQGDIAAELLSEVPWVGPTGSAAARLTATVGAVGMPLRLVPALIAWALLAFIVAVVAAQTSGATWASNDALAGEARRAGESLTARAKAAAEAAQQAAARAGERAPTDPSSAQGSTGHGDSSTSGLGPAEPSHSTTGPSSPSAPQGAEWPADGGSTAGVPTPQEPQDPTVGPRTEQTRATPSLGSPTSPAQQHTSRLAAQPTGAPEPVNTGEGDDPPAPAWRNAPPPEPSMRRE